ncbi:hypothetical protein B0J14DRAFT_670404 [Halenospora varia]|nr:hypothetical protein B0J14DRAFT_670404 [Halenospora varia]
MPRKLPEVYGPKVVKRLVNKSLGLVVGGSWTNNQSCFPQQYDNDAVALCAEAQLSQGVKKGEECFSYYALTVLITSSCSLKSPDVRDQRCEGGKCVAAECAKCGEVKMNRTCCQGVEFDGRCFVVEERVKDVPFNLRNAQMKNSKIHACSGRGTDNEGKCCSSETCNGQCKHQPKGA